MAQSTLFGTFPARSVIKACCGADEGLCNTYESIDDLFGTACCGLMPYNTFSQLCCEGIVRERYRSGSYADQCCGNDVLRFGQTCCEGTVHNVVSGDCCGQAVYSKSDSSFLCCNEFRTTTPTDVCCGSSAFDGGRLQICCGNKVREYNISVEYSKTRRGLKLFIPAAPLTCKRIFDEIWVLNKNNK
ncbi:unnamed protein product [Heligmosomoides polygyrus]|uniref:DB domain-containing protein n=1 Tax=Heligmosomoides polygyrus TaxID=6339 RepID=A0A183FQ60_HELPZ|nr:unnamed protein product [Heligmosomoides polygyrus]